MTRTIARRAETRRLEEELARHLRRTKGLRKSKIEARSSDESSSDDDGQDGRAHDPEAIRRKAEVMGGAWGGDRSTYYDADAVHSDDDDLGEQRGWVCVYFSVPLSVWWFEALQ